MELLGGQHFGALVVREVERRHCERKGACSLWSIYTISGCVRFPTPEQATQMLTIGGMVLRLVQYLEGGVGGPFV
jgi:hypothetical protein